MSRDLLKDLDWDDPHTYALNKLYTLYRSEMSLTGNLTDIGYEGFPDPQFEKADGHPLTPDFLSVGAGGDAQIIDVKGFENIEEYSEDREEAEDKIEATIRSLEKYSEVTSEMVADYLDRWDITAEPDYHELVVLVPIEVYDDYTDTIETASSAENIRVWTLDDNSTEHIWLAQGPHRNDELHRELQLNDGTGITVYEGGKDLIQFTRDTDRDVVKFYFVANMMTYCAHEGKQTFAFDEIDRILTREQKPPMFGHLPPGEREEMWIDCMNSMLDRFELVSRRDTVRDEYKWEKTRFLDQPRDRFKILEDVGDDLGVLSEVE
jgi:hypothetical protein